MVKRILATTTALGAALTGIVCAAPSASATDPGYMCRSDNTLHNAWATWGGANVDSCIARNPADSSQILASADINNAYSSDPCAQLVDVKTGKWLYDFHCADSWTGTGNWVPGFSGNHYFHIRSSDLVRTNDPVVVQVGFWANLGSGLQYYMNVQSPEIIF